MLETDYSTLPSFIELVDQTLHLRSARIIKRRAEGASLRDIALEEGTTRTEARQVEKKALSRLFESDPIVKEDEYRYIYEHYSIDDDFFNQIENGSCLQYYMRSRYTAGLIPLQRALNDRALPEAVLEKLQSYFRVTEDLPSAQASEDSFVADSDIMSDDNLNTEETATVTYTGSPASIDTYSGNELPEFIIDGIDRLWDVFKACGITDEVSILDQISIFLFLKALDDRELAATAASFAEGTFRVSKVFDKEHEDCRWSYFHHMEANELYDIFRNHAFPYIKNELRIDTSLTYAALSKNLKLLILDASMLARVVTIIDEITSIPAIPLARLFDVMISKASPSDGLPGFICNLIHPLLDDTICNPFMDLYQNLSLYSDFIAEENESELNKVWNKMHYQNEMFFGYSRTDNLSSLRISALCMLLRDIESPNYKSFDVLNKDSEKKYSKIITTIPAGITVNQRYVKPSIKKIITANQPQLMCMYACQELLEPGGTCAIIVPHKCLTENSVSHRRLREFYTSEVTLRAIIFHPESSRDILIYRNASAPNDHSVWFARIENTNPEVLESLAHIISGSESQDDISRYSEAFIVPLETINANGSVLDHDAYTEADKERLSNNAPVDSFEAIMRRIYNTQDEIDHSINEIKCILEELQ